MTDIAPPTLDQQALKARSRRNLAIAGALFVFVALIFTVTVVRLSAASHANGDKNRADAAALTSPRQ